jgi:hypothetical protein
MLILHEKVIGEQLVISDNVGLLFLVPKQIISYHCNEITFEHC